MLDPRTLDQVAGSFLNRPNARYSGIQGSVSCHTASEGQAGNDGNRLP